MQQNYINSANFHFPGFVKETVKKAEQREEDLKQNANIFTSKKTGNLLKSLLWFIYLKCYNPARKVATKIRSLRGGEVQMEGFHIFWGKKTRSQGNWPVSVISSVGVCGCMCVSGCAISKRENGRPSRAWAFPGRRGMSEVERAKEK